MTTVRDWLKGLGLERLGDAFEENEIDLAAAQHLTDADLRELDIPMGPRKKLLAGIAELDPSELAEPADNEDIASTGPERRQLTVMFCDMVGSTALSGRLDPEDMRDVLTRYSDTVADVIGRHGGYVANYLGDGVLAYFGWPRASEDQAAQAVRAGLASVQAVAKLTTPEGEKLTARVGIATGQVVVGDLEGETARQAGAISGETPNLAARLQGEAEPEQVVLGERTKILLHGAFELEDLGRRELKGIREPAAAYCAIRELRSESRFEAGQPDHMTPFVGRDAELATLKTCWESTQAGEGQVVLLSGEAGIGKSRLGQMLLEHIADRPHVRLRYQCSTVHQNSAFFPIVQQFERAAHFEAGDSPETRLDKMEITMAAAGVEGDDAQALIASMLSLPSGRYPALSYSPQRQKERTYEILADHVAGLATKQPVLMFMEDLHWIDPTSLEAISQVLARIEGLPVLLLLTFRPEFEPPWPAGGNVTLVDLTRLPKRQGEELVLEVTDGKPLPAEILRQILEKTDGVPLFVEELTKTVLEAGYLNDAGDRYELEGPLTPLAVPSTLQDSLMARLDRLSPVKEVAQIGACIGREFSYQLLAAISPLRENELYSAVQQLIESELIFRRSYGDDASYIFKHALVQDSAYSSILRVRRKKLHRNIAETLPNLQPEIEEIQPEVLAHHLTCAGDYLRGTRAWLSAARRSFGKMALAEADVQIGNGLRTAENISDKTVRQELEVDLRMTAVAVGTVARGWAADDVFKNLEILPSICESLGREDDHINALIFRHVGTLATGDIFRMLRHQKVLMTAAEGASDRQLFVRAIGSACVGSFLAGDFEDAEELAALTRHNYDFEVQLSYARSAANDALCSALCFPGAQLAWMRGYPDRSMACLGELFDHVERIDNAFITVHHLILGSYVYYYRRDPVNLAACIDKAEKIATEQRLYAALYAQIPQARAMQLMLEGQFRQALDQHARSNSFWEKMGVHVFGPFRATCMAEIYNAIGRSSEARRSIDAAVDAVDKRGERQWEAGIHCVRAQILADTGAPAQEIENALRKSIYISRNQDTKSFELRASTALALSWAARGERSKARDHLQRIFGSFTEGFKTADLMDASSLLAELS